MPDEKPKKRTFAMRKCSFSGCDKSFVPTGSKQDRCEAHRKIKDTVKSTTLPPDLARLMDTADAIVLRFGDYELTIREITRREVPHA